MRNDIAKHIERVAKNVLGESKGKRHVFNRGHGRSKWYWLVVGPLRS